MCNHREATPEEVTKAIKGIADKDRSEAFIREKVAEAEAEGHKNEVCGKCDRIFLAFHHFVRCAEADCPIKSGQSVLDCLLGCDDEQEEKTDE